MFEECNVPQLDSFSIDNDFVLAQALNGKESILGQFRSLLPNQTHLFIVVWTSVGPFAINLEIVFVGRWEKVIFKFAQLSAMSIRIKNDGMLPTELFAISQTKHVFVFRAFTAGSVMSDTDSITSVDSFTSWFRCYIGAYDRKSALAVRTPKERKRGRCGRCRRRGPCRKRPGGGPPPPVPVRNLHLYLHLYSGVWKSFGSDHCPFLCPCIFVYSFNMTI